MNTYIIIILVVLVVGSLISAYIYEKKRSEALELAAGSIGLTFSNKGRRSTKSKHLTFHLFSRGHSQKIKNEMWGNIGGMDITLFGYQYTESSGKHSRNYNQTVLSIDHAGANFPDFELRQENLLHKIGQAFGYQDIDFTSYPEFSSKYLLRGSNESKIRRLFSPEVIKFIESKNEICIEAKRDTLIFYKLSTRCQPEEIESFINEGQQIQKIFVS